MSTFRRPAPGADEEPSLGLPAEIFPTDMWPDTVTTDPTVAQRQIVNRLLAAETVDALFDAMGGQTSDADVGKSFEFVNVEWQAYQADNGVIPLAKCDVVDLSSGEKRGFVTTAVSLTAFIRRVEMLNAFPFRARVTGKRTRSGYTALNFEKV